MPCRTFSVFVLPACPLCLSSFSWFFPQGFLLAFHHPAFANKRQEDYVRREWTVMIITWDLLRYNQWWLVTISVTKHDCYESIMAEPYCMGSHHRHKTLIHTHRKNRKLRFPLANSIVQTTLLLDNSPCLYLWHPQLYSICAISITDNYMLCYECGSKVCLKMT